MNTFKQIEIGRKVIGGKGKPFFILEIGCNFEGDVSRAEEMIRIAAKEGADAVKFQTFVPEKIVTRTAPKFWDIEGCPGQTQYEEFSQTPLLKFDEYRYLKKIADDEGIIFFSTPSDEDSADMLEKLDVPLYKISSMDITHLPLLRHVAAKNKPVIISTGAASMEEIKEAVGILESQGNGQIAILHCVTNYPTQVQDVNLNMMKHLMETFPQYPVGYSDHTLDSVSNSVLIAAVALGAKVIEKHFTFDKTRPGYDHAISADYDDLNRLMKGFDTVGRVLGSSAKVPLACEEKARRWARRSLVAKKDIGKETMITKEMIIVKRPATGIAPRCLEEIVGKKAKRDIKEDEVLTWDMV